MILYRCRIPYQQHLMIALDIITTLLFIIRLKKIIALISGEMFLMRRVF